MTSRKNKHQKALEKREQFLKTVHQGEIPQVFNGNPKEPTKGDKRPKRTRRRR